MKLSIITINYNNAIGLRQTMDSVLSQSFHDFEYIIIDGGSSDDSSTIIKNFAPQLTYWCSEPDKGIYNAMNKGIAHATGDYLLFINSGDTLVTSDTLAEVEPYLGSADIIYGNLIFDYKTSQKEFLRIYPDSLDSGFFYNDSLPHPASFISKQLLVNNPYDETYRIVSDWIFFTKAIVQDACTILHIPITVSRFSVDGISSNNTDTDAERIRALDSLFPPMILQAIKNTTALNKCGLKNEILTLAKTRKLHKRLRPILRSVIKGTLAIDKALKFNKKQ